MGRFPDVFMFDLIVTERMGRLLTHPSRRRPGGTLNVRIRDKLLGNLMLELKIVWQTWMAVSGLKLTRSALSQPLLNAPELRTNRERMDQERAESLSYCNRNTMTSPKRTLY